jgi:hypothetical protein
MDPTTSPREATAPQARPLQISLELEDIVSPGMLGLLTLWSDDSENVFCVPVPRWAKWE